MGNEENERAADDPADSHSGAAAGAAGGWQGAAGLRPAGVHHHQRGHGDQGA